MRSFLDNFNTFTTLLECLWNHFAYIYIFFVWKLEHCCVRINSYYVGGFTISIPQVCGLGLGTSCRTCLHIATPLPWTWDKRNTHCFGCVLLIGCVYIYLASTNPCSSSANSPIEYLIDLCSTLVENWPERIKDIPSFVWVFGHVTHKMKSIATHIMMSCTKLCPYKDMTSNKVESMMK